MGSDFDVDELLRANAHALSQPFQIFRKANRVMRDELTVLSYLKASDRSLALLINFNVRLLRQGIRRVIRSH